MRMRILTIGIVAFLIWTGLSGWFYVCQVKGLCSTSAETEVRPAPEPAAAEAAAVASTRAGEEAPAPATLVIHFSTNQWAFTPGADIDKGCNQFKAWTAANPSGVISITGYTDANGSEAYNLALGSRRASAVKDYLMKKGIPGEQLVINSRGEADPLGDNRTEEGRAGNRRAEVSLKH